MRITEIDLEMEDLEWYAVDENGRIAQFTSGGSKLVPEFICESRERLNAVCKFFENFNPNRLNEVAFNVDECKYPREEYLQECKNISQKGLYCFDYSEEQDAAGCYMLICKPLSYELLISDLPETIQSTLINFKLPNLYLNEGKKSITIGLGRLSAI